MALKCRWWERICRWWERIEENWVKAQDRRKTVDGLKAARELIETGWCQNAYALTADGRETRGYDDDHDAAAWCVEEALRRVSLRGPYSGAWPTVWRSMADITGWSKDIDTLNWNDEPGRTKAEVLDAFDQAIARVEGMALDSIEMPPSWKLKR